MSERPSYYENVRTKAAMRWNQLESDPELAGPWHQLFKQVQSPRHILSELLQNADDAGATEASVKVENDVFIFEHNGEDFTEEHFSSLCRFGYSNKRALHTIGFRGIGFKSTFSLGDRVELFSPSLSIAFDRARFTEPKWNDASYSSSDLTAVRVAISDSHRKAEVLKNLAEWLKSPVSLLFFKNIRQLQIGEDILKWRMLGHGPVPNSEWLSLSEEGHDRHLLCRSTPENFPEEALTEIRQERLLSEDEQADFPPSSVDVVLGAEGRLYVVLPTGVRTNLPFACNAPFVQDPARMKIKDPEISPTNRWLLERIGRLAATSMIAWLRNENSPQAEKANAYSWLPKDEYNDAELEGICADIVTRSFIEEIEGEQILLTESGDLVMSDRCVAIPSPLFDVWSSDQVSEIFDEQKRPAFCQAVSEENKSKLTEHGLLDQVRTNDFLEALRRNKIPKPESWRQLLNLWCFADPNINNYRFFGKKGDLQLVPVQGKDFLIAANQSVRLGEKKLLQSDDDWQFIGDRISVVNQNWLRFLAEERRRSEEQGSNEHVVSAYAVLEAVGLGEPSDAAKVIGQVASDFFAVDEVSISDAIRIAQIAAKLGAAINDHFRYVTQDCVLRAVSQTVVFDDDASTELMVPEDWSEAHILHADYTKDFISCSREEWLKWISSGRSGLHTFVPIESKPSGYLYGLKMREEITRRHYVGKFSPKYKDPYFVISDWNFDEEVLEHWEERARAEDDFWARVLEKILVQPNAVWTDKLSASAREYASNGNSKQVIPTDLTPEWILFFRERICLKDSHGHYWKPSELLRRTPETEAVMDVEPFVHPLLDNENTRPLLIALGVGDTPTGPDRLLDRLKGLSSASNAPTHEVEKWYRRLDQMIDVCSTEDFQKIRNSFLVERLILTEEGNWENTQGVYLTSNEAEVPGAEIVRSSVHDLTFWRKIGVSDRPTPDQAISWLQSLASGDVIPTEDIRRVRALLSRHAERIWHECGHWLNLSGKWSPIADIEYGVSMQSLVGTRHLHEWVKDKTANFQDLSAETLAYFPFAAIPALAPQIEYRFHKQQNFQGSPEPRDWLNQLGKEIARIKDDDEAAMQVQEEGLRLSRTKWQTTPGLKTIAYIDGTPAGLPRSTTSVWLDEVLYVEDFSMAQLAKPVAQELGRVFSRPDINEAIIVCVDRNKKFISSYMEVNFELGPYVEFVEEKDDAGKGSSLTDSPQVGPEAPEVSVQSEQTDKSAQESTLSETSSSEMAGIIEVETSEELGGLPQEDITDAQGSDETDVPAEAIEERPADQSKPSKPSLIESYACSMGFRGDGNDRYTNGDGSWIARSESNNFPWALYSSEGDVVQFFRAKDHCLRKSPLEIEAEIWEIIQNRPSNYSLILTDLDGSPWALNGEQFVSMQAADEIMLFPAAYRMVLKND